MLQPLGAAPTIPTFSKIGIGPIYTGLGRLWETGLTLKFTGKGHHETVWVVVTQVEDTIRNLARLFRAERRRTQRIIVKIHAPCFQGHIDDLSRSCEIVENGEGKRTYAERSVGRHGDLV
jgi:hypothetical protein